MTINYYSLTEAERERYDPELLYALEYNPQEGWSADDIDRVLAVVVGENDGPNWHWIVRLKDGRHVYCSGGCDYTGWDCQSSADSSIFPTVHEALAAAPVQDHSYSTGDRLIQVPLMKQVHDARKAETWRERTAKELGV